MLVPVLGVRGTLVAAAAGSLLRRAAWRCAGAREMGPLARAPAGAGGTGPRSSERRGRSPRSRPALALGPALAVASGAATFGVEVLWTRSYALVIGSSVYAFNLMLLAVLLGIAAGAALYARVRARIARPAPARWACSSWGPASPCSPASGRSASSRSSTSRRSASLPVSFAAHQLAGLALCLATMLPVTVVLGLTFPLLLHLADARGRARPGGRGPPVRLEHRGGDRGRARRRPRARAAPRASSRPYLVFAALLLGGRGVGPREAAAWRPLSGARRRRASVVGRCCVALVPRWTPWDPVLDVLRGPPLRPRVARPARLAPSISAPGCASSGARLLPRGSRGGGGGLEDRRAAGGASSP